MIKYFSPTILCFALAISSTTKAKIPSLAFIDVTSVFQPNMEFYSETFGQIALESGLVENLIFYGPKLPGVAYQKLV